MNDRLLPAALLGRLDKLVGARRTGLLTLSRNGENAVFGLEKGEIGYVFYKGQKGLSALATFCADLRANPGLVKLSFDAVPVSGNEPFLPLTQTVMSRFKGLELQVETQTDITTADGQLAPIPGVLLNQALKTLLTQQMEKHIGAVAASVCGEVFGSTRTLRVAVEALAAELSDPRAQQTFRDAVRDEVAAMDQQQFSFGVDRISTVEVSASAKSGIELSDEIRTMIREILPLFMGPQAGTMCNEVFAQTATLRAAVDHIVTEMSNPVAAQQFKEVVRKRLLSLENRAPAA